MMDTLDVNQLIAQLRREGRLEEALAWRANVVEELRKQSDNDKEIDRAAWQAVAEKFGIKKKPRKPPPLDDEATGHWKAFVWVWRALDRDAAGEKVGFTKAPPGARGLFRWAKDNPQKFYSMFLRHQEKRKTGHLNSEESRQFARHAVTELDAMLDEFQHAAVRPSA